MLSPVKDLIEVAHPSMPRVYKYLEDYLYLFPKFNGNYPRVQTNCKNTKQIISN